MTAPVVLPKGQDLETVRRIVGEVEARVRDLIEDLTGDVG